MSYIGTSIKIGGVKLISYNQTSLLSEILRPCKCLPHVSLWYTTIIQEIHTLVFFIYNQAPSTGKVGQKVKADISFTNPLPCGLTHCELTVEGPGLQNSNVIPQRWENIPLFYLPLLINMTEVGLRVVFERVLIGEFEVFNANENVIISNLVHTHDALLEKNKFWHGHSQKIEKQNKLKVYKGKYSRGPKQDFQNQERLPVSKEDLPSI